MPLATYSLRRLAPLVWQWRVQSSRGWREGVAVTRNLAQKMARAHLRDAL